MFCHPSTFLIMSKLYKIQEIYRTLQGEGFHTGKPAVFCRFTGCNLWSGREEDRTSASCQFCDTRFVGMDGPLGGKYTAEQLLTQILQVWAVDEQPFVVFTGGEPALQLDDTLVQLCKDAGCYVAIETNGTKNLPAGLDWVCLSPKPRSTVLLQSVSEVKLVYPQPEPEMSPENFLHISAQQYFLQPMDNLHKAKNTQLVQEYCADHPPWRISVQRHKEWGIPQIFSGVDTLEDREDQPHTIHHINHAGPIIPSN